MLDRKLATSKRRQQVHLGLAKQVVALALEPSVLLFLDDENDISRLDAGRLIALARKLDLVARLHALVNVHLEHLALGHGLFAIARLALVLGVDDLARAVTVAARLLDLLHHRAELAQDDAHALAVAGRALLDSALFAADAVARLAQDRLAQRQLLHLALVQVLEEDADAVHQVLAAARAGRPGGCRSIARQRVSVGLILAHVAIGTHVHRHQRSHHHRRQTTARTGPRGHLHPRACRPAGRDPAVHTGRIYGEQRGRFRAESCPTRALTPTCSSCPHPPRPRS